jgi:plasmid maintenance system antidote protein VapI
MIVAIQRTSFNLTTSKFMSIICTLFMKTRKVTIMDIARELKVAKSTVSRVLCEHPDISKEMKATILEVAARLDDQPNLPAQV